MSNKQQRQANANNYRRTMGRIDSGFACSNCLAKLKHGEAHFVPPSMGEPGFYICQRVKQ